ncbi:Lrp/AsnC ligand binding domain-containing protein [Marinifaba aquimaris]|uniref:Lrp/AsnC ligand binding domain-containing protein n=1 Tax=Marinifaba aquimaris TaxID=2741323 RepID=UPI001C2CF27A|nr:Lrp/AsnC ligand binding domain-containing protein [Marinifaba aquimaris]
MAKLDRIDKHILVELQKDGRLANVELARRVGLSPTPCLERVKRLEREGFIEGYRAKVNYQALGHGLLIYIEVKLSHGGSDSFKEFSQAANLSEQVLECHFVSGEFDFLIKVRVADMSEYRAMFDKSILALPHVKETKTIVVMEEIKNERDCVIYP